MTRTAQWPNPNLVGKLGIGLAVVLCVIGFQREDMTAGRPYGIAATVVVLLAAGYMRAARWSGTAHGCLPAGIGGRQLVDERGLKLRMAAVLVLLLAVPVAVVVLLLAVAGTWFYAVVAAVGFALSFEAVARFDDRRSQPAPAELQGLVQRLAVLADMPAPPLVVVDSPAPTAWTERGRIHVTSSLVATLERHELEAVVAHELAHMATRDAILMELCADAASSMRETARWCLAGKGRKGLWLVTWGYGMVLWVPGAIAAGLGRVLVPGVSRTRELAADAGAAALCGSPAALASALLKLDGRAQGIPRTDLRVAVGRDALGIVALGQVRSRIFATHPPVAERVERLQAMESRLQA